MKKNITVFCLVLFIGMLFFHENALALLQDSTAVNPAAIQKIETFDDLPVGTIIPWPSNKQLPGESAQKWLLCDGATIPAGGKFELLRAIVGGTTPRYNDTPGDYRFGVFLRGSTAPRIGVLNADTTEEHTHEQKPHSHKFNLEVAKNFLEGETLSAKYMDGKRGWDGILSSNADALYEPWKSLPIDQHTGQPLIPVGELLNEINSQPYDFSDPFKDTDGWGPESPTVETGFTTVRDNVLMTHVQWGDTKGVVLDLSEMAYTTSATVEVYGTVGPKSHSVPIREDYAPVSCSTDKDGNTSCSGGYFYKVYANVTCSGGSVLGTNRNVSIKDITADDPDFLLRSHGSKDFLGKDIDKDNSYVAAWGNYGIKDIMSDSELKGVQITQRKVTGQLHEDGGDDSSLGYDLRDVINSSDGQETMPAHITVRYIIKALP